MELSKANKGAILFFNRAAVLQRKYIENFDSLFYLINQHARGQIEIFSSSNTTQYPITYPVYLTFRRMMVTFYRLFMVTTTLLINMHLLVQIVRRLTYGVGVYSFTHPIVI